MAHPELPDTKAARVDWVIRADTNAEMRRRYDIWASVYDDDIGAIDDYLLPVAAAKVARDLLDPDAVIFDAGAGTGLVGQALHDEGFTHLIAADFSAAMLDIARRKQVYRALHECDLSQPTDFDAASMDCVISCGTTSQMPSASLREFARIVRPGGHIVFGVIPDFWISCGYAAIQAELEAAGKLSVLSKGAPFQMMPTTEPEFMCEIWVMQVQ